MFVIQVREQVALGRTDKLPPVVYSSGEVSGVGSVDAVVGAADFLLPLEVTLIADPKPPNAFNDIPEEAALHDHDANLAEPCLTLSLFFEGKVELFQLAHLISEEMA